MGPLVAIFVVKWWGMEWLWIYVLLNVAAVVGIMRGLPKPPLSAETRKGFAILHGLGRAIQKAGAPSVSALANPRCSGKNSWAKAMLTPIGM